MHAQQQYTKTDGLTTEQPVAPGTTQTTTTQGNMSNLDEAQPIITSRQGVNLSEQQQVVVKKAVDGNVRTMSARADAHLNEPDWDLAKMLFRENLVGAFQWALTDTPGTEISITGTSGSPTDVPQDLLQNDIVSSPFLRFQWFRCDEILVRFQITASRFHQGRLLAYFVPTMKAKSRLNPTASVYGPTRATQVQHLFLDPANGFVGELAIPFRYNKGFLDLIFGDVLGQIRVQVLNSLQAATGASTSVEVKVFVSFKGAHFRVPRPGGASFETLHALARKSGYVIQKNEQTKEEKDNSEKELAALRKLVAKQKKMLAAKAELSDEDIIVVEEQSGAFERAGAGLGSEIDKLVEDIMPAEVSGLIAGIALDKPAATEYPEPLVHKDAQYMSASRGVEKLERMTLEPSAQYITTDQFGDTVDEMDMKYLLKKPVYLSTFNWAATQTVGTELYSTVTSPTHFQKITTSFLTPTEPHPMNALANLLTYWRGGFVLLFQIIGTAFHEGRLDFCNHPGTTTVPSDYATALSQYVNSQTVRNTNNTIEVRIPFHSDTPWKRIWFGENLSDVAGTSSAVRSMDYVIGCFSVRVAVPLKNPNNVANNVDVNIFLAAADDFEFHTLSLIGGVLSPFLPSFAGSRHERICRRKRLVRKNVVVRAIEEAGDLNTDSKDDTGTVVLGVGSVYTSDPPVHHFGETYSNLREMCKRYWHQEFNDFTLSTGDSNLGHLYFSSALMGGLPGYLSTAYQLFRGPLNGKLQMELATSSGAPVTRTTGFVSNNPQPAVSSSGSLAGIQRCLAPANNPGNEPRMPPLVRFSQDQVAEFQVPFQSIYHSLLMDQPLYDLSGSYFDNQYFLIDLPWCINTADTASPVCHLTSSYAFADETRFGVFLGFPPMMYGVGGVSYPNPGS